MDAVLVVDSYVQGMRALGKPATSGSMLLCHPVSLRYTASHRNIGTYWLVTHDALHTGPGNGLRTGPGKGSHTDPGESLLAGPGKGLYTGSGKGTDM